MRDSSIFYRSFYEAIKSLPESNQLEVYNAIFEYSFNFVDIQLTGLSNTIFTLIKPQLEANNKRYKNGTNPKNKQNGSKTEAKEEQKISKVQANKNKNENNNVNENKNNNLNDNYNNNLELEFNQFVNIKDWIDLWIEWLNYKKSQHKFKFANFDTEKKAIKQFLEFSNNNFETAQKIINQSITNGWKGLFELKENKPVNVNNANNKHSHLIILNE